jgi:hypothetical protein
VKEKIRILHLWNEEKDARELVRHLAETGFQFEAKLVKTNVEYVSALVRGACDLIIVDENLPWCNPGEDDLSPFQIAEEIAPGVPFLLIADSSSGGRESGPAWPAHRLERQQLSRVGPVIEKILLHRKGGESHREEHDATV